MLDAQTKQRINSARDILVGKVPDPKAQVEQITFALIYKFMHDMDIEAQDLGAESKFFCGEFEQYAWSNLLSPTLGGNQIIKLYGDGIEAMEANPDIPGLFRDVFKNAYLPYRDPQTLKSFLKIINEFEYDHSERLGDAFEYLLSILGSQGDAGQFRTPRHIIEFVVEVLDPQKSETIMDPACGTAGFLISAYKHILKSNSKDNKAGAGLTPDERIALTDNVTGYDISPDMVRLSLVNLYLHGFTNPNISEYDTLTNDDKWNEYFDVILANPPFMSPKGGIRPHNRFSIQAKRSEVLFVDYIAEHLNPNGRAGVIVPEGIIFQSQNAYKQLREMLVNDYLYAVVSLPAGVFQPYSGVKTSILILDREKSKQNDSILFVKVDNDGFDLGAQRRKIDKNDLPQALQILQTGEVENTEMAHWVEKSKIAETGDWNLSGERYIEKELKSTNYKIVELQHTFSTITPPVKIQKKNFKVTGKYPIVDQSQDEIAGWTNDKNSLINPEKPLVIFGDHTCAVKICDKSFAQGADGIKILQTIDEVLPEYLYFYLKENPIKSDGYKRHFKKLKKIKIPLPPLSIQEEIVKEIEGYQKIIDGARQVVDNYKPTIKINPDWEMVKLGEVCEIKSGGTPSRKIDEYWNGNIPWVGSTVCKDKNVTKAKEYITDTGLKKSAAKLFKINTTLIALVGATIGKTGLLKIESTTNQNIAGLYPTNENELHPIYLYYAAQALYLEFIKLSSGKFRMANLRFVRELRIHLPSLSIQQEIVTQIESEQEMVNTNKKLIEVFEQKIKDKISEVWGEDG